MTAVDRQIRPVLRFEGRTQANHPNHPKWTEFGDICKDKNNDESW